MLVTRLKTVTSNYNGQDTSTYLSKCISCEKRPRKTSYSTKTLNRHSSEESEITTHNEVTYLSGVKQIGNRITIDKANKGQTPISLIPTIFLKSLFRKTCVVTHNENSFMNTITLKT